MPQTRFQAQLQLPAPCAQPWAAVPAVPGGRHCAACQHTVVDWTRHTDAELLGALQQAAGGRLCGRVRPDQLGRALRPAAPPAARWRAWLAAATAAWGLHEGLVPPPAAAQTTTQPTASPATPPPGPEVRPDSEGPAPTPVLRGRVTDAHTHDGLPGVAVLIAGTATGTATDAEGGYSLPIPPELQGAHTWLLQVTTIGYSTQQRLVATGAFGSQDFELAEYYPALTGEIVVFRKPWPWHPRAIYYRTKYLLARMATRLRAGREQ